ncbi:MAG: recombinase family protein [Candidatus Dormibacteria bacterium]
MGGESLLPEPAVSHGVTGHRNERWGVHGHGRVRAGVYARVASADLAGDLDRQVAALKEESSRRGFQVVAVARDIGSGFAPRRRQLWRLLEDPTITVIMAETADRIAPVNAELVEACLRGQGRRFVLLSPSAETRELGEIALETGEAVKAILGRLGRRPVGPRVAREIQAVVLGWANRSWAQ